MTDDKSQKLDFDTRDNNAMGRVALNKEGGPSSEARKRISKIQVYRIR